MTDKEKTTGVPIEDDALDKVAGERIRTSRSMFTHISRAYSITARSRPKAPINRVTQWKCKKIS